MVAHRKGENERGEGARTYVMKKAFKSDNHRGITSTASSKEAFSSLDFENLKF